MIKIFLLVFISSQSRLFADQWTTYTYQNGLAGLFVYSIQFDANCNKWFGVTSGLPDSLPQGGVSKFNDTTWISYNTNNGLPDNNVISLSIDEKGFVWAGTENGVAQFDGYTWEKYDTTDGLVNNDIYSTAVDLNNAKWFGSAYGGVSKYNDTTWTTYNLSRFADDAIWYIYVDSKNNKWFGSSFSGVYKFNDTIWTTYDTSDGLENNCVHSITCDSKGIMWFATLGGICSFDGNTWQRYNNIDSVGKYHNNALSVAIDSSGYIWGGFFGDGLFKFNEKGDVIQYNQINSGLISDDVWTITVDKENNKWIGTSSGVSKFTETTGILIMKKNGDIMAIPDLIITPNPFREQTIISFNGASNGRLGIYDLQGKLVKDMSNAPVNRMIWDGCDEQGKKVKAGVYIVRVEQNGNIFDTRIMKLR